VVDWRQLQRWGISEDKLPSGAVVRFRTPSLWEQYKWYVLVGMMAIVAQFALIISLIVEMRRGKKSDLAIKNLSGRLIMLVKKNGSELHASCMCVAISWNRAVVLKYSINSNGSSGLGTAQKVDSWTPAA
jgi:hypothetical protein